MNIKRLVKPNVLSLHAYETSEVPCRVKLDANESPYGFRAIRSVKTNRYPDPEARELRSIVARQFRVRSEMILHGNGSDELISCLITTFGGPVLFPVPTFSMYGIISRALGEESIPISLDGNFDIDLKVFVRSIRKKKPKLIFLSSPNNPTGNSFSPDRIARIIREARGLVVVDEAYQAFSSRKSLLPMMKEHGNLVILKTLSKIGLAGLRIGFLIARPEIIREVNKVRLPFNVNALSQELAVSALKWKERMRNHIKSVISERKKLYSRMKEIEGVEPWPSDANFILFKVRDSDKIFMGLLNAGVLIRNMKGVIDRSLRVTVGTPRENAIFLSALKRVMKTQPPG
jgi:histidinol-phosphate aminotransferase